jgi:hypothetical protein
LKTSTQLCATLRQMCGGLPYSLTDQAKLPPPCKIT